MQTQVPPITEHICVGDKYDQVKKVYSISILYCDYGQGDDYVYHGETRLPGPLPDLLLFPLRSLRHGLCPRHRSGPLWHPHVLKGLPDDVIKEVTGICEEEISKIRKQI